MSRLILTADEAIGLLPDGDTVHNFASSPFMLIGCDFDRAAAIAAIRGAVQIEIGGEGCKGMRHPIVVWDTETSHTFFEADMDKVAALEAVREGAKP